MKIEIHTQQKKRDLILDLNLAKLQQTSRALAQIWSGLNKVEIKAKMNQWERDMAQAEWKRLQIRARPLILITFGSWRLEICPRRKKKIALWRPIEIPPPGPGPCSLPAESVNFVDKGKLIDLAEFRRNLSK